MKFDYAFRSALLIVLVFALAITAWHLSWLHNQKPENDRYWMESQGLVIHVLDRQSGIVYTTDARPGQGQTSQTQPPQ